MICQLDRVYQQDGVSGSNDTLGEGPATVRSILRDLAALSFSIAQGIYRFQHLRRDYAADGARRLSMTLQR
jgi:hypothetical protein